MVGVGYAVKESYQVWKIYSKFLTKRKWQPAWFPILHSFVRYAVNVTDSSQGFISFLVH